MEEDGGEKEEEGREEGGKEEAAKEGDVEGRTEGIARMEAEEGREEEVAKEDEMEDSEMEKEEGGSAMMLSLGVFHTKLWKIKKFFISGRSNKSNRKPMNRKGRAF